MKVLEAAPKLAPYLGALTRIDPQIHKLRIVGFDTEDNTRGIPISFAFHDGVTPFYTTSWEEAIDYIYNYEETAVFVAHNLEYDIGNLFKHPRCNYKYCKELIYASKLLHVTLYGTKNYFLNSGSFFQGPLAKMGKLVGYDKLEGDVFDPAYNIRDALIPQVFMTRMQERLNALGVNLGISIGQLAMGAYRRNFLQGRFITYNHPKVLEAYYGGRVEMFFKGILKGPVYNVDINSSYPDVMYENAYPDTGTMEDSTIDTHVFGVGKFIVDVPASVFVPPLPYRSPSGRLFFPPGKIEGTWTYAEVRKAVAMGATIIKEEIGVGTNQSVYPFRDFISHFWDERAPVKKALEKNPNDPHLNFESLFLKLLMNNLYGKFAQHKPSVKMLRVRLSKWQLEKMKGAVESKVGPFYGYTIPKEKAPRTANYLWGVYITAYARLSLLDKIMAVKESGSQLVYCDTDAVTFTGDQGLAVLKVGDGLGEMGVEKFDLGVFRQAKGYLLCDEVRKVIRQSKGRLFSDGEVIAEGVQRRLCNPKSDMPKEYVIRKVACKGVPTHMALPFIRDGITEIFRKPMRLKEGLIRVNAKTNKNMPKSFFQDVGVNVWKEVQKTMEGVYIKRKAKNGDEGILYPIDVLDIPEAEKNAFPGYTPMAGLQALQIRRKSREDKFLHIKIPRGWFKRTKRFGSDEKFFESQDIHFFKLNELLEINAKSIWFSGKCIQKKSGKYGNYFMFFVKSFLGADVSRKKFIGALPEKFLAGVPEEKIMGKYLEVILDDDYIMGTSPELSARVE